MLRLTVLIIILAVGQAASADDVIHSKTYGTWQPPALLLSFWSGVKDDWFTSGSPNAVAVTDYLTHYAKTHKASAIIPAIMQDSKDNWTELRISLYSGLIRAWDKKDTLKILNNYNTNGDPTQRRIASDFIADIEEASAQSK